MLHPLLERQLKRVGIADGSTLPDLQAWREFLERISRTYTQTDQDRYLLERSLSVASEEMQQEIAERKQAEIALERARDELEQQNRRMARVHELVRSTVEQMVTAIGHGTSPAELHTYLHLLQSEFERLDEKRLNGH